MAIDARDIVDFRTDASADWDPILEECAEDMKAVAGDPWDEVDRKAREDAGRPCLVLDELNQYFNQGINALRANPLGMRFSPAGDGADDKGAEFYENKAREIEYRSSAQIAYITAAENMFQQGIGWVRVTTKFASSRSWDQEIWIEPVMNPTQVLPGPHVWPDGRDLKGLLYIEPRSIAEFKREFGKSASVVNFSATDRASAPQWISNKQIDVGEFWVQEPFTRKLLMLTPKGKPNGPIVSVYEDELKGKGKDVQLPPGLIFRREREVEDVKVCQYLTNGVEILKTTPWAGKHIPFVSFYGKVLYVNGKKIILSQTRLMRDPYMAYCFWRTCEIEMAGLVTKNPYWAYENQLDSGQMTEIAKSLHEPVAVLLAKHTLPGLPPDVILPLPQRNPLEADIQSYSAGAENMRRAIQAAAGITPQPSEVQRRNDISGEAWKQRESTAQMGSYHYKDHYKGGVQRTGEIVEDLIDKIHDTARDVWVHEADETPRQVRINDPRDQDSISTKGKYLVTVSAAPATESQRSEANDFVDSIIGHLDTIGQLRGPQVASAILALSIKLKQLGPIGDQIADLIEPPEMKAGKDGTPPDPRLFGMQQTIQQLQKQLQDAGFVIKTKQVEGKTKYEIEQMKVQATSADKAADREVKLAIAELGARIDRMALFMEESQLVGARHHDATQSVHERRQQVVENAKDRSHDNLQARLAHLEDLVATSHAASVQPPAAAAPAPVEGAV